MKKRGLKLFDLLGETYSLYLLSEIAILVNQLRDLLLKAIILLHKKLIHGRELPVDSL